MTTRSTLVGVPAYNTRLLGDLSIPETPGGLALVAHTTGRSRWSPRERQLVAALATHGLAALRLDLLTREESAFEALTRPSQLDVDLLAKRLISATDWLAGQAQFANLPIAYIGAGVGAAAALVAAAERPLTPHAVVLIDGRTDRAAVALDAVTAPTLLIVGRDDTDIVAMNERTFQRLQCLKRIELIDGAATVLESAHAVDDAGRLAAEWLEHFRPPTAQVDVTS